MTRLDYEPEEPGLTPARALEAWRRRKWLAAVVFVATLAGALGVVLALPDLYHASATVLVDREVSQDFVKPSVTSELETRIQTIHQEVTSRDHLAQLIEDLNLYPDRKPTTPIEDLVARMNRDISLQLKGVEQTNGGTATIAFVVGFTGRDPEQVATVVNRLANTYVTENGEGRKREAAATAAFLRGQLDEVKKELDAQDTETRSFALTYTNELPQQLEANLAALERLQGQLSNNSDQQLRLLERRERLEQELTLGRVFAPAADTNTPAARLQVLRQELSVLQRTFSDEYPDVKRVKSQIAALEAEVARTAAAAGVTRPPLDPAAQRRESIQQLEAELAALRQEADRLSRAIASYESTVGRTPRRQIEMDRIASGRDLNRQRYEALLQQYESAERAAALEAGSGMEPFRVLNAAIPPARPIGPDRPMLAGMGLLAALGLAFVVVVAREKFDNRLHGPDDLRGLVSEDAIVPVRQIQTWRARRRAIPTVAAATIGAVALAVLVAGAAYYSADGNERLVRMTLRGTP